jgi:uncharacterized protein (UPF0333 family)
MYTPRKKFIYDNDAVIELPFKLILASVIILITVSVAYAGLESYSKSSTENAAETAAKAVISAAAEVSTLSVNSSVKATVDINSGLFHRIESFVIGCGPNETVYKCKGVEYKVTGSKAAWLVAKDQAGHDIILKGKDTKISVGEGTHDILLTKCKDYVKVSRA